MPETPERPVLPPLPSPGTRGPAATGIIISRLGPQALLTFPGESNARVMNPGESVNGWTLMEVQGANVALVREDVTGSLQNLLVPENTAMRVREPKKPPKQEPAPGKHPPVPKMPGKRPDEMAPPMEEEPPMREAPPKHEVPPMQEAPPPAKVPSEGPLLEEPTQPPVPKQDKVM